MVGERNLFYVPDWVRWGESVRVLILEGF